MKVNTLFAALAPLALLLSSATAAETIRMDCESQHSARPLIRVRGTAQFDANDPTGLIRADLQIATSGINSIRAQFVGRYTKTGPIEFAEFLQGHPEIDEIYIDFAAGALDEFSYVALRNGDYRKMACRFRR